MNHSKKLLLIAVLATVIIGGLVATSMVKPAQAAKPRGFHFVTVAGTFAGCSSCVINFSNATELLVMDGTGQFDPSTNKAKGEGTFEHVDNTTPKPKTVIAFGTWTVTGLVSYTEDGTYAAQAAGTLVLSIDFSTTTGAEVPATLTVVCHAPFATFAQTSAPEGINVVAGGTTFRTLTPGVGVTFFDLLDSI